MKFLAFVGLCFLFASVGSIVLGFVRGLIARHKLKKAVKELTENEVSEEK